MKQQGTPSPPPAAPFCVAAIQMDVEFGSKSANLARIEERLRAAHGRGAELIVFPECAVTGYCFESLEEAREYAEPVPGPAKEQVGGLCEELNVHVIFGLVERAGDHVYNCAALVGPGGFVVKYRKLHMPHLGLDHFATPGDQPLAAHSTPLGRIGVNICYDGSFPETARILALDGADLIALPTNWPIGAEEFATYAINTRAMENVVYYAAANRVGKERGFRFIGTSRIVDIHGRSLAEADGESETILTATIDPALARQKRIVRVAGKHWIDRFADRRPELYRRIAEPRETHPRETEKP